jgi:hypothetical protein
MYLYEYDGRCLYVILQGATGSLLLEAKVVFQHSVLVKLWDSFPSEES